MNALENERESSSSDSCLIDSTVEALLSIHKQSRQSPSNENVDGEILAYAKLLGEGWHFYINKLSVVLGRRTGSASTDSDVDVHLGDNQNILDKHARIEYNFICRRWELILLGKQGFMVNGSPVVPGVSSIVLTNGYFRFTLTLICGDSLQIFQEKFSFWLPEPTNSNSTTSSKFPVQQYQTASDHPAENDENAQAVKKSSINTRVESPLLSEKPARKKARMIFIPTHDDQTDWKSERADPKKKPPYSYASLIAEAIMSTKARKMTLSKIYSFIQENYIYYRYAHNGWQNSVRHNLSLNNAFVKVPRDPSDCGKGMYWTYVLNGSTFNEQDEVEDHASSNSPSEVSYQTTPLTPISHYASTFLTRQPTVNILPVPSFLSFPSYKLPGL